MPPKRGKKRVETGRVIPSRKARRTVFVGKNNVSAELSQETQPPSVRNTVPSDSATREGVGVPARPRNRFRQTRRGSVCAPQPVTIDDTPDRMDQEDGPEDVIPRRGRTESSVEVFPQEGWKLPQVRGPGVNVEVSSKDRPQDRYRARVDGEEVNRLKNEVVDLSANLNRTRETLMASVEMHIKKIKELEKEVAQKDALCESLKRPTQDCTCSKSSASARRSKMEGIEEKFQSVTRSVFDVLRDEASDIVRELVPVNGSVLRDWTGKVLIIPAGDVNKGKGLLKIGGQPAVPKCPMETALKGEMYTKPDIISNVLGSIIDGTIQDLPDGMFDDDDKRQCLSRLSTYRPLRSWFSRVLSEEASTLKMTLRCTFFENLGYLHIKRPAKDKNEKPRDVQERTEEQDHARKTLLEMDENGLPNFALWRVSPDEKIQYEEFFRDEDLPADDLFFKNQAAKTAFLRFRNHEHEHIHEGDSHASILSLARADAWIAVSVQMFSGNERHGGKRNSEFKKLFRTYLPLALEAILNTIRSLVLRDNKGEMMRTMKDMPPNKTTYTDERRLVTQVFRMPGSNVDYLAVKSQFISRFSPILGEVKDCYIGRCSPTQEKFNPILARDETHYEESDIEVRKEGEHENVGLACELDMEDDEETEDAEVEYEDIS